MWEIPWKMVTRFATRGDGETGNQQRRGKCDKTVHDPYTGPLRDCSSNMWIQHETTACNIDNIRACGSDDHQGSAKGWRSG